VQRAPGFPCALFFLGRTQLQNSGVSRRENANSCWDGYSGDAGIGVGWLGEIGYQLALDQGSSGTRE
jgi:hypothetical protein